MTPPFPFKGSGYAFYKRIEPRAFRLNQVLWELRIDPQARLALLRDPDEFAAVHALAPDEADALREQDIVKLNAAGGHAILGWGVILLLRFDARESRARG